MAVGLGKIFVTGSGGTPPLSVSLDEQPSNLPGPASPGAPLSGWHTPPYTFSDLNTGSYRVFLQDAVGCIQSYIVPMSSSQYPTFSFHATDVSCFNQQDGSLTGSIEGGIPPFTFLITPPSGVPISQSNSNEVTLYSLNTGSYLVKIEDAVGCEIQENFIINSPGSMSFSASADYTDPDNNLITFHNVNSAINGITSYNIYEYAKDPTIPFAANPIINQYISLTPTVNIPSSFSRNKLRGGFFGAFMETPSTIANVTCSTDIQYQTLYARQWGYNDSYCEQVTATSNPYRILNFYRARHRLFNGTVDPTTGDIVAGDFVGGMPLDGVNIKIYTGSASEVDYDPNNPTRDKLISEFNTSGSLEYTGSFSYINTEDLVVVMENAQSNNSYTQRILKKPLSYRKDGNDITASLIVTGALLSGSTLNYNGSDYFGNLGNPANTSSLILTMSKVDDEINSTTWNFEIVSRYLNIDPNG
tara:strand:- start:3010 stop:4428 length:1419 start_codon:yes stop_codon:yes gene_type:complete